MPLSFRYTATLFALAFLCIAGQSRGAVTITAEETSDGLLISGSGTLNLTGLSYQATILTVSAIRPARRVLLLGGSPSPAVPADGYLGINGPTSFGSHEVIIHPDVSTGDRFGITFSGITFSGIEDPTYLIVPDGYVSGAPLFGSNLYEGFTFNSFGLAPGSTYIWSLPNDTLSLQIIPEPTSCVLGCIAAVVILTRRKNRTHFA